MAKKYYSSAVNKAVQKYDKLNYDRVTLRFRKGEKQRVSAFAKARGKSLNGYILGLIKGDMEENEKMKKSVIDYDFQFDYRTDARNSSNWGWTTTCAWCVFGRSEPLSDDIKEFLASLTNEWRKIPREWLDPTTSQNFICFARKATRQIKI